MKRYTVEQPLAEFPPVKSLSDSEVMMYHDDRSGFYTFRWLCHRHERPARGERLRDRDRVLARLRRHERERHPDIERPAFFGPIEQSSLKL